MKGYHMSRTLKPGEELRAGYKGNAERREDTVKDISYFLKSISNT